VVLGLKLMTYILSHSASPPTTIFLWRVFLS
jgi:hypothetical protein